jgi:two-component system nitrogen regulation response regulator GlnG
LIVDDDEAARAVLTGIVRARGIIPATAASLAKARARIAEKLPDVVIIDIELPDGNGMELVSGLRA